MLASALFAVPAAAFDAGAAPDVAPRATLVFPDSLSLHTVAAATQVAATAAELSADRARREPKLQWYGWPIAAADGAGVVLTALWLLDPDTLWPGFFAAAVLFGLGAPVTHWVHGFVGRGFLSLGVRSAAELAFMIGAAVLVASDEDPSNPKGGYVIMAASALGLVTMSLVDLALLAFEPAPQRSVVDEDRALTVTPWLVPRAGAYGAHVSLRL